MKHTLIRLALEAAEDRLTPSHGWDHPDLRPDFGPAVVAYAPVARDDVREIPHRPDAPDWEGVAPRFLFVMVLPDRPDPSGGSVPTLAERLASGQRGTAAEVRAAVTAEEAAAVTKVAAVVRDTPASRLTPAPPDRGGPAPPAPTGPASTPGLLPPTPGRAADIRLLPPPGDRPAAAADGTWPVLFVASTVDPPTAQPVPDASQPELPARATPPDDAPTPTPSVVARVIEAALPVGVPLHGVLPAAAEWVETGAADLLAGLDDLTTDAADGMPMWEQMTWLAGAVLVLGGVTYTVGTRRGRRPDRAVIGTDSALARWEDSNARRTPG